MNRLSNYPFFDPLPTRPLHHELKRTIAGQLPWKQVHTFIHVQSIKHT